MLAKLNVIVCHVQNKVLHHAFCLVPGMIVIVIFIVVVVVVIVALSTCIAMQ